MLFLVPETVAGLSIQWGNYLLPMLVIWVLGSVIIWRLRRFHITFTYVVSFIAFGFLRSWLDRKSLAVGDCADHRADVPAFYFLHDHRSEDHGAIEEVAVRGRISGGAGEMIMRMYQIVYAPFYALFIVGPTAMLIEIWLDSRRASAEKLA